MNDECDELIINKYIKTIQVTCVRRLAADPKVIPSSPATGNIRCALLVN